MLRNIAAAPAKSPNGHKNQDSDQRAHPKNPFGTGVSAMRRWWWPCPLRLRARAEASAQRPARALSLARQGAPLMDQARADQAARIGTFGNRPPEIHQRKCRVAPQSMAAASKSKGDLNGSVGRQRFHSDMIQERSPSC